jgi:hypothetical protein
VKGVGYHTSEEDAFLLVYKDRLSVFVWLLAADRRGWCCFYIGQCSVGQHCWTTLVATTTRTTRIGTDRSGSFQQGLKVHICT